MAHVHEIDDRPVVAGVAQANPRQRTPGGRIRRIEFGSIVALTFALTFACPGGAVAQQNAAGFAAGGIAGWGADVSGVGARTTQGADIERADGSARPGPRTATPQKPKRVAKPAAAAGASGVEATTAAAPPPGLARAGALPRGPIVVRPPAAATASALPGTRGAVPAAAAVSTVVPTAVPITPPASAAMAPGECLAVNQIGPGTYQIENAGCRNAAVLATIEIRNGSRSITCYIARIRDAYAVTSPPGAPPRINHQCRDGTPGCAEQVLKGMFPECRGSV